MFVCLLKLIVVHRSRPFVSLAFGRAAVRSMSAASGLMTWSYYRGGCRPVSLTATSSMKTFLVTYGSVSASAICRRKAFVLEQRIFLIFKNDCKMYFVDVVYDAVVGIWNGLFVLCSACSQKVHCCSKMEAKHQGLGHSLLFLCSALTLLNCFCLYSSMHLH